MLIRNHLAKAHLDLHSSQERRRHHDHRYDGRRYKFVAQFFYLFAPSFRLDDLAAHPN